MFPVVRQLRSWYSWAMFYLQWFNRTFSAPASSHQASCRLPAVQRLSSQSRAHDVHCRHRIRESFIRHLAYFDMDLTTAPAPYRRPPPSRCSTLNCPSPAACPPSEPHYTAPPLSLRPRNALQDRSPCLHLSSSAPELFSPTPFFSQSLFLSASKPGLHLPLLHQYISPANSPSSPTAFYVSLRLPSPCPIIHHTALLAPTPFTNEPAIVSYTPKVQSRWYTRPQCGVSSTTLNIKY